MGINIKDKILDLLYPPRCPICDSVLRLGEHICKKCANKLPYVIGPRCSICSKTIQGDGKCCEDCEKGAHLFLEGRALFSYTGMEESMYRFKYSGRAEYARFYATELARKYHDVIQKWKPDAFVPVPIHKKRMRQRGYNQASEIAKVLGERFGVPVCEDIIVRQADTKPMKNLSVKERQNNLKKAFKICKYDVKLDTIVIIDDIYTTGSTLDAMTDALRILKVKNVYFLTVTIGNGL